MLRARLLALRWAIRLRELSELVWEHKRVGFLMVLAGTVVCGWWLFRIPSAGYAVTVMGLVAALMTARTKASGYEKAAWMLLMFGLLFVELKAIRKDRLDNEARQAQADKELKQNFSGIAEGIRTSIAESDRNVAVTMGKTNKVLNNITGGNSFAYVAPQNFYGDQFPGVVWNNGEQALSGLTLTIAHTSDPVEVWGAAFFQPIFIGTIGPHEHAPIPGFLFKPKADEKTRQDNYWIMLSAQNGTASQSIYFRRNRKNPANWAYSFSASRQILLNKPQSQRIMLKSAIPKGANVFENKLLLYRGWSDELADTPPKP
jgi:hypothetical protein